MEPHRLTKTQSASRRHAFTLIELLAVMTIMAILFAIGASIASGAPLESMKLTEAAQTLSNELARARQFAMTKNREVEFRVYQNDPHKEGTIAFHSFAYGVVEVEADPASPDYEDPTSPDFAPPFVPEIGRTHLQPGHRFIASAPYSTLISGHPDAVLNVRTGIEPRNDGDSVPYAAFTFLPEGRAALDSGKEWTLTVIRESEAQRGGSELRKNFVSIQIQPESGRARTFRP